MFSFGSDCVLSSCVQSDTQAELMICYKYHKYKVSQMCGWTCVLLIGRVHDIFSRICHIHISLVDELICGSTVSFYLQSILYIHRTWETFPLYFLVLLYFAFSAQYLLVQIFYVEILLLLDELICVFSTDLFGQRFSHTDHTYEVDFHDILSLGLYLLLYHQIKNFEL